MAGLKMANIFFVIIVALLPVWAVSETTTTTTMETTTTSTMEMTTVLYAGENCFDPNLCADGLTCENDVCRLNAGEDCSGPYTAYCATGLTCDSNYLCRLNAGEDCSGPYTAYCATGLECDSNYLCRLNPGEDCSSPYTAHCATGLTCENDSCSGIIEAGHECNLTEQCTNNSYCGFDFSERDRICVCYWDFYSPGGRCEPRFGPGHECNSTEQCTHDSVCRYDQSSGGYTCVCHEDFYSLWGRCEPQQTTAHHQHVSHHHTTPPPATTPWLTTVPYWMSLTTATSRDFHWAYTPQDYERLVVCAGHEITIPWRYTLGEGEQVEDVTWFRVPEGGVSEDIALFGRGHFLAMPAYTGRVQWTGEGGIVLSGATVGDSGRYTVVVTVVSPSKNSFSKYQRTVDVQVAEPPQTYDGHLHVSQSGQAVKDNVTGAWSIQLTCGHFYTRGHPPVDVEWTTPDGYSILSSNYSGGQFTLLLPSPPTGGNYSCRLLPNELAPSCLPYYSHLLEVATVEVNEVKAGFSILSAEQGEVRHQLQELQEENRLLRQDVQSCGCLTGRP